MASCVNHKMVNIEGVCSNCMDGTPIELYYLQNDSVINVASDTCSMENLISALNLILKWHIIFQ